MWEGYTVSEGSHLPDGRAQRPFRRRERGEGCFAGNMPPVWCHQRGIWEGQYSLQSGAHSGGAENGAARSDSSCVGREWEQQLGGRRGVAAEEGGDERGERRRMVARGSGREARAGERSEVWNPTPR